MTPVEEAYLQGFMDKCAQLNVNPTQLLNKAIQTPVGQGALRAGAGVYNRFVPQGWKDRIGGSLTTNPNSLKDSRFTADPTKGMSVNSQTNVHNTAQATNGVGNAASNLTEDITTKEPGFANSPLQQLKGSLQMGRLPYRTFAKGTPVTHHSRFTSNEKTNPYGTFKIDRLEPRAK
jgi:hypothetical protein